MDYKQLCIKQYGYYAKDMYPHILGPKDMTDKKDVEAPEQEAPSPHEQKLLQMDEIAQQFNRGWTLMRNALQSMPDRRERAVTITHAETAVLWAQNLFNNTRLDIEREAELDEFRKAKQEQTGRD